MTQRFLDTPDGRLAWHDEGQGPAVLLIQGAGVIGNGWRPQIDGLSGNNRIIAPDNRGIGGSSDHRGPVTIESMAEDAMRIMDIAGIRSFHLGGHSMGGLIAQAIALRWPERVQSLTLMCTFARGRHATAMSMPLVWRGLKSRIGPRAARQRAFLSLVFPDDWLARQQSMTQLIDQLQGLFGHDLATQPPVVMKQLGAMRRFDVLQDLARLAGIPTLVLSAEHDLIARPSSGLELAGAIPGAGFEMVRGAGHALPIQCAEEVNDLLRRVLAGNGSR